MSVELSIDAWLLGSKCEQREEIQFEVGGSTVGECLDNFLSDKLEFKQNFLEDNGKLKSEVAVFLNSSLIVLDPLVKKVKTGDRIRFLDASEGG